MKKIAYIILGSSLVFTSCKDFLDRPVLTEIEDSPSQYWRNENDVRLFANDFYTNYFVGYNLAFGTAYAPVTGYNFSDDLTKEGTQTNLLGSAPTDGGGSTTATPTMLRAETPGPNWNFYWVRKANIMLNRVATEAKANLTPEALQHWEGVGRFFRGYEYSRLVSNFGDVPYYDVEVSPGDDDQMYKSRDDRGYVMDKVYDDFKFAMANLKSEDGANYLNRYVAASLISNLMLFEGSWQTYHNLDASKAKKYLELTVEAAELVMNSGKWSFGSDFKSLFASQSLVGNPEVIFYRVYDDALAVRHAVGSYNNGTEAQSNSINRNLLQAFICNDGNVWQNSSVANASNFRLQNLVKTRDPRFEASIMDTVNAPAVGTRVYSYKFASREALTYIGKTYPAIWASNTNTSDAPVVRLAEVVLNWIEAKQILAEKFGGPAITQSDLNKSINAIRNRPLDAVAIAKGVQKTAPLQLATLPNDPKRDMDVSPLMWEIRRERRMELVFEYARIQDIRRWKKLDYFNFNDNSYKTGAWVIGNVDFKDPKNPGKINPSFSGKLSVMKADGTIVTFTTAAANDADIVGYYYVNNFANRLAVQERNYLAPVSISLIQAYADKGYTLTQTKGW